MAAPGTSLKYHYEQRATGLKGITDMRQTRAIQRRWPMRSAMDWSDLQVYRDFEIDI